MAFRGRSPAIDSRDYQRTGDEVQQILAFTYLYPAIQLNGDYRVVWPWQDEDNFRRRFLSSYSSAVLVYPQQAAAEGALHEVEFISPNAVDNGEPLYLAGYFFEKEDCMMRWREACQHLQLGGERGYGFGRVDLIEINGPQGPGTDLFGGHVQFKEAKARPVIRVSASGQTTSQLLAHTLVNEVYASGDIEPFVGREWRSNGSRNRYAGQYVAFTGVCFVPGSVISQCRDFEIEAFGIWKPVG
jgi:hypothetical protein